MKKLQSFEKEEAESFVYKEAKLLDEGKYSEWLRLFTDDALYWVPTWSSDSQVVNSPNELAHLYLDKNWLQKFVERILTGNAYTYEPAPRTTRYISNVMLGGVTEKHGDQQVFCNWLMHLYRNNVQEFFGGTMEYHLRRSGKETFISFKRVTLINDLISKGQLILL